MISNLRYKKMFECEKIFSQYSNLQRLEGMDYDTRIYRVPLIYRKAIDFIFNTHELMYSDLGGDEELHDVISKFEATLTGVTTDKKMIFVGSGVSSLINLVIEAILKLPENINRREIILFAPDYPLFHSSVEMANGTPVMIQAKRENNYIPTVKAVEDAITNQTAAILFSNLNNPTGQCFSKEWTQQVANLSELHNFFIVSDEVYSQMLYHNNLFEHFTIVKQDYHNYIKLFGLSKDRPGMTGMRTGYCIGDQRLYNSLYDIQMVRNFSGNIASDFIFLIDIALRYFTLSNVQVNELKYFESDLIQEHNEVIAENEKYLKESIEIVLQSLKNNNNVIDVLTPQGGNSVFFRYHETLPEKKLLEAFVKKGLAVYPTEVFHLDSASEGSWLRICVTKGKDYLKNAIARI